MFFSILIPVFNAADYLDRCLESIINQTCDDYEIVIVDDGSTDNSTNICKRWQNLHNNRIRFIENHHSGSLLTRRKCFSEARGDYFYVIDADDYLLDNNMLALIKRTIQKWNSDLVFFRFTRTKDMRPLIDYPFKKDRVLDSDSIKVIYRSMLTDDSMKSLWNKVFSRELIDWNEDYNQYAEVSNGTDFFQLIPIISAAKRIVYLDNVWYYYSNTPNSIVNRFNPLTYSSLKALNDRLSAYSLHWGIDASECEKLLARKRVLDAISSVIKIRYVDRKQNKTRIDYIKRIGDDDTFRESYEAVDCKSIAFKKRIFAYLLYRRKYTILNLILSTIGALNLI